MLHKQALHRHDHASLCTWHRPHLPPRHLSLQPTSAGCTHTASSLSCATDSQYISIVKTLRAVLPRPALLTTAAFSVGAYGQGDWLNSQPASDHTGMNVNVLKSVGG